MALQKGKPRAYISIIIIIFCYHYIRKNVLPYGNPHPTFHTFNDNYIAMQLHNLA